MTLFSWSLPLLLAHPILTDLEGYSGRSHSYPEGLCLQSIYSLRTRIMETSGITDSSWGARRTPTVSVTFNLSLLLLRVLKLSSGHPHVISDQYPQPDSDLGIEIEDFFGPCFKIASYKLEIASFKRKIASFKRNRNRHEKKKPDLPTVREFAVAVLDPQPTNSIETSEKIIPHPNVHVGRA